MDATLSANVGNAVVGSASGAASLVSSGAPGTHVVAYGGNTEVASLSNNLLLAAGQSMSLVAGDNLFIETAASGQPITGNPNSDGLGNLQQSYLEESNVNAVTEISSLIAAQRAYEMNAKVITATDQMLSATSQMFRG
jgi:flagellar basal-body rod protein FlgG